MEGSGGLRPGSERTSDGARTWDASHPLETETPTSMIVASEPMRLVVEQLERAAPLDTTVLLMGESGVGKELAARLLHERHPARRRGPFVRVHCGAIPENLLESELFGHVRGAFTGAERDRMGRFEEADGGTLLLDEIATMSAAAQVKLLRVLQDRHVIRVGANQGRRVDVRIVVATNEDLRRRVDEGLFRLDLYYRLSTFPVTLPPLRERPEEIPPLAEHFARRVAARLGLRGPKVFSSASLRALLHYSWPGNVRELENAVEFATIMAGAAEAIGPQHLPREISGAEERPGGLAAMVLTEEGLSLRAAVSHLERELILQSLRISKGNKARAAELLQLKRTTFLEKLRKLEREGWLEPAHPERSNASFSGSSAA